MFFFLGYTWISQVKLSKPGVTKIAKLARKKKKHTPRCEILQNPNFGRQENTCRHFWQETVKKKIEK